MTDVVIEGVHSCLLWDEWRENKKKVVHLRLTRTKIAYSLSSKKRKIKDKEKDNVRDKEREREKEREKGNGKNEWRTIPLLLLTLSTQPTVFTEIESDAALQFEVRRAHSLL